MPKWAILLVALLSLASHAQADRPIDVPLCDLSGHPQAFNGRTIRVRGTLNVYFEDFTLSVGNCKAQQPIWLAFGGDVPGIVSSTTNDTFRKSGTDLKVNDISYSIVKNDDFRRLYALIAAVQKDKPEFRVRATLTGAFFAGEQTIGANGQRSLSGYGHLGCCSLLVITQVSHVVSSPRANLDVSGTVFGSNGTVLAGFEVFDDVLGGSPPQRQIAKTDSSGNFRFSNSGQLLRFENPSYRPVALPVETGGPSLNVRLEDARRSDWIVPPCQRDDSIDWIGFSALFKLPLSMEFEPFDSDRWHALFVFPHGSGSADAEFIISQSPEQVEETTNAFGSRSSEERWIKDGNGKIIGIDARGVGKHGEPWRTATFWEHETASYNLRTVKTTRIFDAMLDSACTNGKAGGQ